MKIISFNVNGIRSICGKSKSGEKECPFENNVLNKLIEEQNPDILCLQEIRCQTRKELDCYKKFFPYIYANFSTVKKGYSGTAILSKTKANNIITEFNNTNNIHKEGRIILAEFENYYVVNVYTPNSKDELARLSERLEWDRFYENTLKNLKKPYIACGDLNCALEDIDIHNPKVHHKSAGFSDDERKSFKTIIENCDLIDTFRYKNPTSIRYTYWSNMRKARENNRGWRIDYILTTKSFTVHSADTLPEYFGSDHCPIVAEIE